MNNQASSAMLNILRISGRSLWIISTLASIAMAEIITCAMELLLKGGITWDYVLTGFVAAFFVAGFVTAVLTAINKQLARSEEQARQAIDASHLAIWDYDLASGSVHLTEQWAHMLGLEPQPTATTIQGLTELVPEEDRERVKMAIVNALNGNNSSSYKVEHRVRKPGGGIIWVLSEGVVTARGPDGLALRMSGTNRDITERKAVEEQMKLAGLVYQAIGDAILITDASDRIIAVNHAFTGLTGFSADEAIGQPASLLKSDYHDPAFYHELGNALDATGIWQGEIINRHKNGDLHPEWVTINTIYDEEDRVQNRVITFSDYTRRKQIEQSHRSNMERLEAHIKNSPLATIVLDSNFNITEWTSKAKFMFGWNSTEALGKNIFCLGLVPETDMQAFQRAMTSLFVSAQKYSIVACHAIPKSGKPMDCIWYNSILSNDDGTIVSVMSQVLDVSQQKMAEQARHESEQRFRILAAATAEGVVISSGGKVLDANEQIAQMLGYTQEEMLGKDISLFIAPEHKGRVLNNIREGMDTHFLEHHILRKDGSRIVVEANGKSIIQNGISLRLSAIHDITQRKQLEAELVDAKTRAEDANNAKSRFLAAASHDLRQPLSALRLYVGVLKKRLPPADGELMQNIDQCVSGLSELLSKLLDLSMLEANAITPDPNDFLLAEMMERILSSFEPVAKSNGLDLRVRLPELVVRTDQVLLKRIISNFVSNALRYTRRGGAMIGVRRQNGKHWLCVWDTGIGIPADKTSVIFEEFQQLGGSARTHGSGLGLAIAAKTAALLKLQIRVHSSVGKGSMFAIELPVIHASFVQHAEKDASRICGRIAVVDDNPAVLDALARALRVAGNMVVAAASGSQLLAMLGSEPPDALICDYRLSDCETGFDVIASVRAGFDNGGLPAIVITGDTDPSLMSRIYGKGIDIMHKPLDLDKLLSLASDAVRRNRQGCFQA